MYMGDFELEWLGENDIDIHCIPQTALVSVTPIILLGSITKRDKWLAGLNNVVAYFMGVAP